MNEYILSILKDIMAIDSPSGYTKDVIQYCQKEAQNLGFETKLTNKGNLQIFVNGQDDYTVGFCAHVDTLGLMVRSIKDNGTLAFTNVGGPIIPTLDGEYCRIITRNQQIYTGTILSNSPAAHVYEDAKNKERTCDTMHIRIDEKVKTKEDVQKLGICNGDYIAIETKTMITDSGFIKSRFLDDKMSVAILFGVLKHLSQNHIQPQHNLYFMISTFEEVGHGSSYISHDVDELIAVDMGCIGQDLDCSEYDVSICAKDSSGPYDYELTSQFIHLAKTNHLQYAVDVYPFYSSDVSAALRGGQNIKGALIGPGVHASHGMERTHIQAVENTYRLVLAYIHQGENHG